MPMEAVPAVVSTTHPLEPSRGLGRQCVTPHLGPSTVLLAFIGKPEVLFKVFPRELERLQKAVECHVRL